MIKRPGMIKRLKPNMIRNNPDVPRDKKTSLASEKLEGIRELMEAFCKTDRVLEGFHRGKDEISCHD